MVMPVLTLACVMPVPTLVLMLRPWYCTYRTTAETMLLTVVHVAMVHIVVHALPEAALFASGMVSTAVVSVSIHHSSMQQHIIKIVVGAFKAPNSILRPFRAYYGKGPFSIQDKGSALKG